MEIRERKILRETHGSIKKRKMENWNQPIIAGLSKDSSITTYKQLNKNKPNTMYIGRLTCMLLVSRYGLLEENAIEVFHHHHHHHLSSSFSCKIKSPFRLMLKCGSYPISFQHLHSVEKFVVHPPSRIVSHPKGRLNWPLSAHPPSEKAVGTW